MTAAKSPTDWSELVQLLADRVEEQPAHVLGMLRELLLVGRRVVNCSEAAVMVPDAAGTNLRFLETVNSTPAIEEIVRSIQVPCDRSLAGCVFNTGQLVAIANPDQFYQAVDQKTGLQTSIYLVTPVLADDEVLGVLTFVNRPQGQPQEPFNEAEIEWGQRLADLAAAGIKLYQRLQLQQRLFRSELARASESFAADTSAALLAESDSAPAWEDQSPVAVALGRMEKMSRREQSLAAEVMRVLASFDQH
jgi:transcriptional regulator with GAF, ATPase, and Fis domain